MIALALGLLSLAIWVYLIVARGGFWRCASRLEPVAKLTHDAPSVVAVVPARDEAQVITQCIVSLLRQEYPGEFGIVLVDDHSSDDTAEIARRAACSIGAEARLRIVAAPALAAGWTGKLWALKTGTTALETAGQGPEYLWLTDADIAYAPDALRALVAKAQSGGLALTSIMASLRSESPAERALVPAFVFFFQMLYPFAWVNDAARRTAAAAGGCMLVRREVLDRAGGLDAIRNALIDDCALAKRVKPHGAIWLGFSDKVKSLRAYGSLGEIRRMVARTAYCQLRYSPLRLAFTAIALSVTFLAPPVLAFAADGAARVLAIAAWVLMGAAFQPTLRFYRASAAWGWALPLVAAVYLMFTMDSALQHRRARGGLWKGRAQAQPNAH